jgi:NarL family two-component system response regulator LiaR
MEELPGLGLSQKAMDKVSIMLVDDHPLLRQALRTVLEREADFEIVAEADDGEEAVRLALELVPNVVIMDINMPKLDGLEATRQIKAKCPSINVLVLTVYDSSEYLLGILEAGAAGYLTKRVYGQEVVHAIRAVVAGDAVLSPQVFNRVLKHALKDRPKPVSLDLGEKLTTRELEILNFVAIGLSNKDIASKLNLSLPTVKGYLVGIFDKLNVGSRTEAVVTGLRAGFINLDAAS